MDAIFGPQEQFMWTEVATETATVVGVVGRENCNMPNSVPENSFASNADRRCILETISTRLHDRSASDGKEMEGMNYNEHKDVFLELNDND
ncbi:MAG: hypothetical protein HETSPECPRED_005379 [Heterodermia speciosa]|uniref:Uncharacterized protein n=1 Tax=Heterodermia speciosa TaxID=116794 RepID=A0A8H3IQF4_9LECA|nr:MAG: hypothetical protein HETSPECPRED_005379 [Heterodermia speciosa]